MSFIKRLFGSRGVSISNCVAGGDIVGGNLSVTSSNSSFLLMKTKSLLVIDGKEYTGRSIKVTDDGVYVDGKKVDAGTTKRSVSIAVTGDVDEVDICSGQINVEGNVSELNLLTGNANINGNAEEVSVTTGDVRVGGSVMGSASTTSGDISASTIHGSVSTTSGDVYYK